MEAFRGVLSVVLLGISAFCFWKSGDLRTSTSKPVSISTEMSSQHEEEMQSPTSTAASLDPVKEEIQAELPEGLIAIDAGHGGADGGAVVDELLRGEVVGKILEKDWTLRISNELTAELEKRGHGVFRTRTEDVTLALERRSQIANERKASIFVSIHLNTSSDQQVAGAETYHSWPKSLATMGKLRARLGEEPGFKDPRGLELATKIQNAIAEKTGSRDRGVKNSRDFSVTRRTICPAVLVECGFLTNEKERTRILGDDGRRQLVEGLADGIEAYLAAQAVADEIAKDAEDPPSTDEASNE